MADGEQSLCYDCQAAPCAPDLDTCLACQEVADEAEYERRYCRAEHGGACDCWMSTHAVLKHGRLLADGEARRAAKRAA
jgi:hypothetical protein